MLTLCSFGLLSLWTYVSAKWSQLSRLAEMVRLREKLYFPESFRPESPYLDAPPIASQIQFWTFRMGVKTLIGHGIRIVDNSTFYIVAPVHVVRMAGKNAQLFTSYAYKTDEDRVKDSVESSRLQWRQLMNDVCIAVPPPNVLKAGKTSSIGPVKGKLFSFISTGFTVDRASMGELSTSGFGLLKYEGSTRAAFSGAAYVINNRVVGMHLGGGCQNLGVAMSYLLAQLRHRPFTTLDLLDSGFGVDDIMVYDPECSSSSYVPEAYGGSELEYLKRALKNARVDDWSYAAAGLDDMEVEYNGVYFTLEREAFSELLEELDASWDDEGVTFAPRKKRPRRKEQTFEYEPEAASPPRLTPVETLPVEPPQPIEKPHGCSCGFHELYQLINSNASFRFSVEEAKYCQFCQVEYGKLLKFVPESAPAPSGNGKTQSKPPASGKKLKEATAITVVSSPTNPVPSTSKNPPVTTGLQKTQKASKEASESTQTSDSEYEEVVLRKKKRSSRGRRRHSGTRSGSPSKEPQTGNPPTSKVKSMTFSAASKKTQSQDSGSSKMNQLLLKLLVGTELSSTEKIELISSLQ